MGKLMYRSSGREWFMASLTFMTVATNQYLDYWFNLYESFRAQCADGDVYFQLFTDRKLEADQYCEKHLVVNVTVVAIPKYVWPEATLLRYEIFAEKGNYERSGVYAHIDADMVFADFNAVRRRLESQKKDLLFVKHPGFFRPKGFKKVMFYSKSPISVIKDFLKLLRIGGLGAWEDKKLSGAFVPYFKRSNYCCGGVWFGKRESFSQMCNQLSQEVRVDIANGVVAKWHDESFLNRYSAFSNNVEYLGPEFCFVDNYSQLTGVEPLIKAVEKGANKTR